MRFQRQPVHAHDGLCGLVDSTVVDGLSDLDCRRQESLVFFRSEILEERRSERRLDQGDCKQQAPPAPI